MSIAITEEQHAVQASIRDWSTGVRALDAVRAMEAGSVMDSDLWRGVADLGVFSIAVPEELGGAGGSAADLAAAIEQLTAALVPGPITSTLLAGLLLRGQGLPEGLAKALADGEISVAVGRQGELTATVAGGQTLVSGVTGPILGAGTASHLLLSAGERWFLVAAEAVQVEALRPVDFSRSLGRVRVAELAVEQTYELTSVEELTAALAAAEAAGVAGWCVRTAAEYAKVRQQFGRPIGSFQAVKHLCAEMLCRSELAAAVAWDAARAIDERVPPEELRLAASVAASVALDAAMANAKDCIQVLGGIGFTWEHEAHFYLRRAMALQQLLGGSASWRARAAEQALAGVRRDLSLEIDDSRRASIRETVRDIAALPEAARRAALVEAGFLAPGKSTVDAILIDDELAEAGVAKPDLVIGNWALPTILQHGSPEQQERFVEPTLLGEIVWCQLFSEPEAGSDLAGLRTRAERAEGGYVLNGQKVWTSLAREAHWGICLARTDPEAPKHKGLGYFLVDMRSRGIEIRPLREMTGRSVFNEVFLDNVFVPDDCLVGGPADGWRVARATLANERVAMGRGSSLGEAVEELLSASFASGVPEELGALVADGLAVSLLDLRSTVRQLAGQPMGAESAVAKLVGVRHRQAVAEAAWRLSGVDGATLGDETAKLVEQFLLSRCLSIAGGTTQVLLSLTAERVLGLPRDPQ